MSDFGALGKMYNDGETIGQPGDPADAFYVVQEGKVAIVYAVNGREIHAGNVGHGEIVGDWALDAVSRQVPLLRAKGSARVLTVHRRLLMQRIHEDPTLAFRILEMTSRRIHEMAEVLMKSAGH